MDKPSYQAPQGRLTSTFVIFLFVLLALYTLFLLFQQRQFNRSLSKIGEDLQTVEAEMELLREEQIKEVFVAESMEEQVSDASIAWSKVVRKFQELMPVSVFFSSYTGGQNGSINVSGLGDDYDAVADMISALERSTDFDEVFVPSVTLGNTVEGQEVVSFTLQVNSSD